jgi:4-hydroxybenzoate polyprenyltransferase
MLALIRLARPKQWTKNLLVFAAWLFTSGWSTQGATTLTIIAFVALCLASSAVYIVNDLLDAEQDKLHPTKRLRPIAAGLVSKPIAIVFAVALLAGGLVLSFSANLVGGMVVFLGGQVIYNLGLKHIAGLDVLTISMLFVQRAAMGALALQVYISPWLLFCTGTLAFLVAVVKRRQEFIATEGSGQTRASLTTYSKPALDGLMLMGAVLAAMSYGIYAIESSTAKAHPTLLVTVPVVLYAVVRYVLIAFQSGQGEEPETVLFSDTHMICCFLLFVGLSLAVMSGWSIPLLEGAR